MIPALQRHRAAAEPGPRRRPATAQAARRHWLVSILLLAGLVLRVLTQLAYRPALFYIDSTRYLYHAAGNDPAGYRVPLRAILLLGNLDTVAAVQHLLGLAMAVAIYAVLLGRGAPRWLAALAVAPVLLDAYQLQIEQTIMPDVWFEALIVAGLALLLWPTQARWWTIIGGGLALGTAATFRQVGEVLIGPALVYVLIASGWRLQAIGRAAGLCAAFALPILAYCSISFAVNGHFWLSHSGTTTIYGRVAEAADCATMKLPASQQALCPNARQKALGPDGLEHSPLSPLRPYYANLPHGEASRTVSSFNRAVVTQQPLRVLSAVASDAAKLFALKRVTSPGDTPIWRWQFQGHYPTYSPHATSAIVSSAAAGFGGGRPVVDRPVAFFLRHYQLHGGYTPGPLYALAALAGLLGSLGVARRRIPAAQRQLALACVLFFTAAAADLVASDIFEFSWRYQLPALVTLPPAGALGIAVITGMIRGRGTAAHQVPSVSRPAATAGSASRVSDQPGQAPGQVADQPGR